jgi:ubiquinone/menaquinone biosynthesis C-methylase UbiE
MYGCASHRLAGIVISLGKQVEETNYVYPDLPRTETGPNVLDVGIGFGVLGMLLRHRLLPDPRWFSDAAVAQFEETRRNDVEIVTAPANWWAPMDGIEGNLQHRGLNGVHAYFYRNVFYGDVFDVLGTIPDDSYDVVVAADILEYFAASGVHRLLSEIERVARHYVIIAVPCTAFTSGHVAGSPLESHYAQIDQSFVMARGYNLVHHDIDGYTAVHSVIAETLPNQDVLR